MNFRRVLMALVCASFLLAVPRVEAQANVTHALQGDAAYTLPPAKLKVAIELNRKRTAIEFADTAWTIVQLVLLLSLGAAAWMRRVAVGVSRNRWVQGFAFYFLFLAITSLLSLPLEVYGHHVSLAYGQSVQPWGSWFADKGKSFLLSYGIGGLLVMLLFLCIGKSPKRWWFWFWIPTMAAVVFGVFVSPILIDPIFNKFEPLQASNPALVARLEQVVARGGIVIPPERMFLMRASEKVTGLNAYVTGIGASKRVVVWDTSIAKATPDEISYIFGHEMGHYVLNHIYKGIAAAAVGLLAMFFVGYHCVQWLIARYGAGWGIPEQHNWAAFVVIMLVFSVLSFLGEPIGNGFSRGCRSMRRTSMGRRRSMGSWLIRRPWHRGRFRCWGRSRWMIRRRIRWWSSGRSATTPVSERARFAKAGYDPWAAGEAGRSIS